ncbi:MAG: NADH-quinone oxidoreductase subunit J [Pseudomonadota bacterium]
MGIEQILFYCFSALMLTSALMVVISKNSVKAVLFLVLAFVSAAFNWMLLEAEFLSVVLILVYVGAVMVLFLFVVMMLDIEIARSRSTFTRYAPIGLVVFLVIVGIVGKMVSSERFGPENFAAIEKRAEDFDNTKQLGDVLFTEYFFPFELAGLILLIAIIAAISLTFRGTRSRKSQDVAKQVKVSKKDRLRVVKMKAEQ